MVSRAPASRLPSPCGRGHRGRRAAPAAMGRQPDLAWHRPLLRGDVASASPHRRGRLQPPRRTSRHVHTRRDAVCGRGPASRPVRGRGKCRRPATTHDLPGQRAVGRWTRPLRRCRQRPRDRQPASRLRALAAHPRRRAHRPRRRPGPSGLLRQQRQDAHLHRGRHQRQRVRGHGRHDAGPPRPDHDAAGHERGGRQHPQPLDPHRRAHVQPGRSRHGHPRQRRRRRHEPRLLPAVAAGGADRRRHPAAVAGHRSAAPPRLRHAHAGRRRHEAAQPWHRRDQVLHVEHAARRGLEGCLRCCRLRHADPGDGLERKREPPGDVHHHQRDRVGQHGDHHDQHQRRSDRRRQHGDDRRRGRERLQRHVDRDGQALEHDASVHGSDSGATAFGRRHSRQPRRPRIRGDVGRLGSVLRPDLHVVPRRRQFHL